VPEEIVAGGPRRGRGVVDTAILATGPVAATAMRLATNTLYQASLAKDGPPCP